MFVLLLKIVVLVQLSTTFMDPAIQMSHKD